MGKILNKVKEKKLKAIKSEISEISKLVSSSSENKLDGDNVDDLREIEDDTITLTKIVDNITDNTKKDQFSEIMEEIRNVRFELSKQDKILEDILLKLSKNN